MNFKEIVELILKIIGGFMVVLAVVLTLIRNVAEKYISTLIEKSANKELEKIKSKLSRSMSAYEFLLNKEFEYYQNLDKIYASLVVDVQDIYWNAVEAKNIDFEKRCSNLNEISLRIIKTIPELKNFNLMYQCYVPSEVYMNTGNVVICLQNDLNHLTRNVYLFYDRKDVQEKELKTFVDNVLISIALSNNTIKTRLGKLSE